MCRDAVGRRASSHAGAVARRFFGVVRLRVARRFVQGDVRPRVALAMRQQLTTAADKTRPRKRPYQGNNPARRATRAGCEAAGRCTARIAAIRLRMRRASCVHREACIKQAARGWRGNAAIGLALRRRMSGRREPMPEDSGAGNRKIIASVTATQQGSARLAVRALPCR
jgi:hypothetical protein